MYGVHPKSYINIPSLVYKHICDQLYMKRVHAMCGYTLHIVDL